jgi:glycosyltransferase involved in cell wall biosynthesis
MPTSYPSLHVLGSRQFGGADQFFVRLVRALREAGQTVTAIDRAGSPVAQALAQDGTEQIHLPLANQWDAWTAWKLRKLVEARQPCIVQTYMGRATRLTRLSPKTRAAHIARLGGYYKIDGYYRHAHAWIGNTKALCDYLVQSGLPAARVFHIGNFVPAPLPPDPARSDALRREFAIPEGARIVFALARLIEKKGFEDLLRAWALMPAESGGRPLLLLIAGDGPQAGELHTLAERLGLSKRVRWLGWQDPPDACYALAEAFVCPSREEPLGNVILEAWSRGLPTVSTATAGALELIEEGRAGLLCPIRQPEALAGRLRELLEASDADRRALGEAGREYLYAHFGKTAILKAYLDLYEQMARELSL